jgi:hypothetical protein
MHVLAENYHMIWIILITVFDDQNTIFMLVFDLLGDVIYIIKDFLSIKSLTLNAMLVIKLAMRR